MLYSVRFASQIRFPNEDFYQCIITFTKIVLQIFFLCFLIRSLSLKVYKFVNEWQSTYDYRIADLNLLTFCLNAAIHTFSAIR